MNRSRLLLFAPIPILLLLTACATRGPEGPLPSGSQPGVSAGATAVVTQGGLYPTGEHLAQYLRARYPAYENGRWAVGWSSGLPWMGLLGKGVEEHWPSAVTLEGMGAEAASSDQAYIQLDPSSFAGLIWLDPVLTPKGRLEAVEVTFRPTGSLPYLQVRVACEPSLSLTAPANP